MLKSEVKTFVVGLANGISSSMQRLDELVKGLGSITIQSIVDTPYEDTIGGDNPRGPHIIRVVIFQRIEK